jgi:acyl-CoA reductase-like NAD-dependent aldehyde dehydrogenase
MDTLVGRNLDEVAGAGDQLMWIDGEAVTALDGSSIDIFNPSTGGRIGTSPAGKKADIDRAVEVARRRFKSGVWSRLPGAARQKILWRASELLEARADEIATVEALNAGQLYPFAQAMVHGSIEMLRYYAGWATKIHGITSEISGPMGEFHAYTLRDPIGVAGMIVPWNVPFALVISKLGAALAAGCSCIVKPSEETPYSALILVRILEEAGVPKGVVNVVTGYGHEAGAALAEHPNVDKIAFTGSTEIGKRIVRAAAGNLKKVTLELGGKSPVIMFDDADLAKAIPSTAMGIFLHSGQICIAGSRLYVQRKIFDQVVEGLSGAAASLKIGDAFDPATQIGPLISAKQRERVTELVASGVASGAQLAAGGQVYGEHGFYFQPTVLANPKPDSRVIQEEIFGPVITANVFDDFEEVLAAANDTSFGLASTVYTRDISKAHRAAKALQAGFVWINCHFISDPSLPGGGFKQSGWGRELGAEGLDSYLQTKSVFTSLND